MSIEDLIRRNDTPLTRQSSKHELIVEPYQYLNRLPGNNSQIRFKFITAFNDLYFGITNEDLILAINDVCDVLHQCSLLIDDVEDSSEFRRGAVAAHLKFGVPSTINCVNYMYFVVLQRAQALAVHHTSDTVQQTALSRQVNDVLVEEMLNLHHGQGTEIYWRDNKTRLDALPSEQEYLEMAMDKTSGLLRIIVRLLAVFSPTKSQNVVPLVNVLGIIYQLRDDYFNLTSAKYSHSKGLAGEDLVEGKFSFPILHCLRHDPSTPVHTILYTQTQEQRKQQVDEVARAVEYMTQESKSLQYTQSKIKQLFSLARNLIDTDPYTRDQKQAINGLLQQLDDT